MNCGRIGSGSEPDCDDLPEGGTRARLILMNYKDVARIYENNGVITSIELVPGKRAYEFLGFRSDVKKIDEVAKTVLKSRFKHSVGFVVYELDQLQKNNIKRLVKGRFIGIIENRGKDENSIEVVGKNVGLSVVGGVIRDAHSNGGFYVINLATPDNGKEFEKKLPQNLGYSYGEGLTIIDGLLNPYPIVETFDSTIITFDSIEFTFDNG
jgi:hypothetical protein